MFWVGVAGGELLLWDLSEDAVWIVLGLDGVSKSLKTRETNPEGVIVRVIVNWTPTYSAVALLSQ
jgi:hypothetical protein